MLLVRGILIKVMVPLMIFDNGLECWFRPLIKTLLQPHSVMKSF